MNYADIIAVLNGKKFARRKKERIKNVRITIRKWKLAEGVKYEIYNLLQIT